MMKNNLKIKQSQIIKELGFEKITNIKDECEFRINFLADYIKSTNSKCYVLGISGGIDSLVAGMLAKKAIDKLKNEGYDASFIAVRLPYGKQLDETDAQEALRLIKPDYIKTIDIKPATDAMISSLNGIKNSRTDFNNGNIKARQRMIAQYAIAGENNGLVIGTDHSAETLVGFFTKFGDGAADIIPLSGLNKRGVRKIAEYLDTPHKMIYKTPTADLETDKPALPDEEAFGFSYDYIDDFLEGLDIPDEIAMKIISSYEKTQHKRDLPYGPKG